MKKYQYLDKVKNIMNNNWITVLMLNLFMIKILNFSPHISLIFLPTPSTYESAPWTPRYIQLKISLVTKEAIEIWSSSGSRQMEI